MLLIKTDCHSVTGPFKPIGPNAPLMEWGVPPGSYYEDAMVLEALER